MPLPVMVTETLTFGEKTVRSYAKLEYTTEGFRKDYNFI